MRTRRNMAAFTSIAGPISLESESSVRSNAHVFGSSVSQSSSCSCPTSSARFSRATSSAASCSSQQTTRFPKEFVGSDIFGSAASVFFHSRGPRLPKLSEVQNQLRMTLSMPVATEDNKVKEDTEKIGVLLLNLGGPETLDDVRPFLYNLFSDPDIIRTPIPAFQKPLGYFISTIRAPKSREAYGSIGGGSPIRRITEAQAAALTENLKEKGKINAKVYIGMRYWHPYTDEAIEEMKKDGIEKIIILPLYPQFSISTSGSSFRLLEEMMKEDKWLANMKYTVIPSYQTRPGYVKTVASMIRKEIDKFDDPYKAHIFFSAHGVPRSYVEEGGDPYQIQIEQCVDAIIRELGLPNRHTLAYQSRVGPVEWLQPYTEDALVELGQKGVEDLVVVPISFVSEHIETLEEIDIEYRELAEENGVKRWRRVPALDTNPDFIDDLGNMVLEAAAAEEVSIQEAMDSVRMEICTKVPLSSTPLSSEEWGFTPAAEVINGRIAMVASVFLLAQIVSGHLIFK